MIRFSHIIYNSVCQRVEKGLGENLPAGEGGAGLFDELGVGG